jgi:hypothetical protein
MAPPDVLMVWFSLAQASLAVFFAYFGRLILHVLFLASCIKIHILQADRTSRLGQGSIQQDSLEAARQSQTRKLVLWA